MEMKREESVIWYFLKIKLSTTISMKTPREELFIDIVIR